MILHLNIYRVFARLDEPHRSKATPPTDQANPPALYVDFTVAGVLLRTLLLGLEETSGVLCVVGWKGVDVARNEKRMAELDWSTCEVRRASLFGGVCHQVRSGQARQGHSHREPSPSSLFATGFLAYFRLDLMICIKSLRITYMRWFYGMETNAMQVRDLREFSQSTRFGEPDTM